MALQAITRHKGFHYTTEIAQLDATSIREAKERFKYLKAAGIITAGEYDSPRWITTDEVRPTISIRFQIDESQYEQATAPLLSCSCKQYQQAMRVAIISRFGYSLHTLQDDANVLCTFANTRTLPKEAAGANLLIDLLELLPGNTPWRQATLQELQDLVKTRRSVDSRQRTLATYQSYFRFDHLLNQFWKCATPEEKIAYFPVYFWWKVTSILPLRATECTLTPRNCIRKDDLGRYYLTIRRTKVKGRSQAVEYSIEKDFKKQEWRISEQIATEIANYIEATNEVYDSDIDVLFCKISQFDSLKILHQNDRHYGYDNLAQCLRHFYDKVLRRKFNCTIAYGSPLLNNEITRICLGDTRHIAMISLMLSGGSPSICRELASHCDIDISAGYFGNLETFLDLLSYETFRPEKDTIPRIWENNMLSISRALPVDGGYCQSLLAAQGDYSDCGAAISAEGEFGVCKVCRYYLPQKSGVELKQAASESLQQTVTLLRQTINQLQQGYNVEETLSCVLDRLRADASRYCNASAIERLLKECN